MNYFYLSITTLTTTCTSDITMDGRPLRDIRRWRYPASISYPMVGSNVFRIIQPLCMYNALYDFGFNSLLHYIPSDSTRTTCFKLLRVKYEAQATAQQTRFDDYHNESKS